MICPERLSAYQLIAIPEVSQWLDQGWLLYGFPIVVQAQVFQPIVCPAGVVPLRETALSTAPNKPVLSIFERECLLWYVEGLTYQGIAARLKCSVHSVNNQFAQMRHRFECGNNTQLALFLLIRGYLNKTEFFQKKKPSEKEDSAG